MNAYPMETFAYEAGAATSQEMEEEIRRRRAAARRRPGGRPPVRPRPPGRTPGSRTVYLGPGREPPDDASSQDADGSSAQVEPSASAGNEYVRWVQSALNQILGLQLPVDGVMNAQIRKAIMEFQRSRRLPADGIIGPDTERAMRSERSRASSAAREAGDFEAAVFPNTTAGSPAGGTAIPIYDRRQQTPRTQRHGMRSLSTIDALVLHQMAFSRGSDPTRYDNVRAHFAILPDGKILQLHPIEALLWSSHGFNRRSVAVEFAGNFPDIRGRCWQASRFGCHALTPEQIAAGRYLVWYLKNTIGLRYVFAHRQSSNQRTNDPGPDIWGNVGQWAIDNLGIGDGGPGYKIGTGAAIPEAWRTGSRSETETGVEAAGLALGAASLGAGVASLGLGIFQVVYPLVTGGDFSVQSEVAQYMHQNTPASIPFSRRSMEFRISAHHPRYGFERQQFYFRLSFEYNRYDLRNARIEPLRDRSSSMYASTFSIQFRASPYSVPSDPIAKISYSISGNWNPFGAGDVSFEGRLIVQADGQVIPSSINSERSWVRWDGFVSGTLQNTPIAPPSTPGLVPTSGAVLTLRSGARGPAVTDLQVRLNRWLVSQGRQPLVVDGIFGGQTRTAVIAFQQAVRLVPANGVVDPKTWATLTKHW